MKVPIALLIWKQWRNLGWDSTCASLLFWYSSGSKV